MVLRSKLVMSKPYFSNRAQEGFEHFVREDPALSDMTQFFRRRRAQLDDDVSQDHLLAD